MTCRRVATRLSFGACLVLALVMLSWSLIRESRMQFDELASAQSDNVQWVLSQVEVEFLALDVALLRVATDGAGALPDLRLKFDIFFSRVNTLRRSPLFEDLRSKPKFAAALDQIWHALQRSITLIDGPDEALVAQAAALEGDISQLRASVRDIGLEGIAHFAVLADTGREAFLTALRDLAWLTATLFAALLVMIAVLWRAMRILDDHARAARQSASRRSAVIASSLDAVIVADSSGRIVEANSAVEQVFGHSMVDLIGAKIEETIVPPNLQRAHSAAMARYNDTKQPRVIGAGRIQLEAMHKDGHIFPVELSISAARSDDDELFVSFLRDITQRLADEQELRDARDRAEAGERSKARMLATMSHEMRTPLNGLMGTLELLEDTAPTPEQSRYLRVMRSSGEVLLHHINDVLDVSRLDSGTITPESETFSLNALIEGLFDAQAPLAKQRGNQLDLQTLTGPDMVSGDPARLRQILLNLLGNAVKFTEGGVIMLEAERLAADDMVEFRIADTGIGIPDDQKARIFEDFVTLDASYGRVAGGTGLGLGIVRRMVAALGGTFGVESDPGEGSLFWVRLPLPAVAEPEISPSDVREETTVPPQRVLIVEDNEINRMILREMLERLGHAVTEASDGAAGVEAARAEAFDLILMDISMPRMDGVTAAGLVRNAPGASRQTPIVALTAHAMPDEIARFAEAGIARTLVKPATRTDLATTIAEVTDAAKTRDRPTQVLSTLEPEILDATTFDEFRESVGPVVFRRLCDKYLAETDQSLAWLCSPAARTASRDEIVSIVHSLAGSCGLLGAQALRSALTEIEARAKQSSDPQIVIPSTQLETLWAATRPHFVAHVNAPDTARRAAG